MRKFLVTNNEAGWDAQAKAYIESLLDSFPSSVFVDTHGVEVDGRSTTVFDGIVGILYIWFHHRGQTLDKSQFDEVFELKRLEPNFDQYGSLRPTGKLRVLESVLEDERIVRMRTVLIDALGAHFECTHPKFRYEMLPIKYPDLLRGTWVLKDVDKFGSTFYVQASSFSEAAELVRSEHTYRRNIKLELQLVKAPQEGVGIIVQKL